jgi:DNA-binding NarL/FixJ family response regulator
VRVPETPQIVTVVVGGLEPLVGRGVAHVLGADPRVDVLASDLEVDTLERVVAQRGPQVVILGETVEYGLLARLKSMQPATGVLVLARDPSRLSGTTLLADGATCLAWNVSSVDLMAAVHLTAQGEPTFLCADGAQVARSGPSKGLLTPTEIKVFRHLRMGRSYAYIGRALHMAPETVRKHTISICRKLNVKSKRELIGLPATPSRGVVVDSSHVT